MAKKLAIGMTVGLRRNKGIVYDYCEQAAFSLRQAGFGETLHCFTEPEAAELHIPRPKRWGIQVHENEKKLGCFPNFRHGLKWLLDHTDADWLMMLQDDCTWRLDGAARIQEAINSKRFQSVGFLSPYTSKAMVQPRQREPAKKWHSNNAWLPCRFHNNAFWGAVAMLFPRASALKLETTSQRYRNHKHHRKLDVVVGNAMRVELKLDIFVHVPSLCDHVGSWSTLGRHRFKGNRWGRRGFMFRNK
jgi:hypothetical protein